MALTVVALPVPAGNGVGTAVDIHTLDVQKSFALDGTLGSGEQLVVEVTEDPAGLLGFTGLVYWDAGNVRNVTLPVTAAFARIRRYVPGGPPSSSPTSSVSATTSGTNTYFQLTVPASGVGAAVDVSSGGQSASFSIHDGGTGFDSSGANTLVVEGSNDNVSFIGIVGFSFKAPPGYYPLSYKFLRIRRLAPTGAAMSFFMGTSTSSGGGGGGSVNSVNAGTAISITGPGTDPIVNNLGVTSAIAGTGIGVSAATGAVTFTNTGVTSLVAGAGIGLSAATGAVTITNTAAGGGTVTSVNAGTGITISGPATDPIVTSKLSVGVAGGQSAFGGTLTTQNLTLRPNAADTTTGLVIAQGLGVQAPDGSAASPSFRVTTDASGMYRDGASRLGLSISGNARYTFDNNGNFELRSAALIDSINMMNDIGTFQYGSIKANSTAFSLWSGVGGEFLESLAGATELHFITSPFISFTNSGTGLTQANGTVMRFGQTPPNVATATGIVAAYKWDAVTVTFTGGGVVGGNPSFIQIAQPIYTSVATPDWSTQNQISTVYIAGGPRIAAGTGSGAGNLFGLFIDDAFGTGNGSLGVTDFIFANTYQNLGAFNVLHQITAGRTWNIASGAAADGTGAVTRFQMDGNGGVFIGDTGGGQPALSVLPASGGHAADVMVGYAGLITTSTRGYPYMPQTAGKPTGVPTLPFGNMAAFTYDSAGDRLNIYRTGAAAWSGMPLFTTTATAAAGIALINTAPAAVVSLSAKWWSFKDNAGVTTYIPYFQ